MTDKTPNGEKPDKSERTDRAAAGAATELTLEEAVDAARQEYDEICCIMIGHPVGPEQVHSVTIRLYTGEVTVHEMYEFVELFDGEACVVIKRAEGDNLRLPFEVKATCEGPADVDLPGRTTIYMSENVFGAKSLDVADGLAYLEDKLADPDSWEPDGSGVSERVRDSD